MGKKRYPVRFYWYHDMDIVAFTLNHGLKITKAMRMAVTDFARGNFYTIDIPPKISNVIPEYKKSYYKCLILDEDSDKEAIELLDKVSSGARNCLIKNIMRLYFCYPMSELYLQDQEDEEEMRKVFSSFKDNSNLKTVSLEKKKPVPSKKKTASKKEIAETNTADENNENNDESLSDAETSEVLGLFQNIMN